MWMEKLHCEHVMERRKQTWTTLASKSGNPGKAAIQKNVKNTDQEKQISEARNLPESETETEPSITKKVWAYSEDVQRLILNCYEYFKVN